MVESSDSEPADEEGTCMENAFIIPLEAQHPLDAGGSQRALAPTVVGRRRRKACLFASCSILVGILLLRKFSLSLVDPKGPNGSGQPFQPSQRHPDGPLKPDAAALEEAKARFRQDKLEVEQGVFPKPKPETTSAWAYRQVPASGTSLSVTPKHAADSLMCRESVKNFVINATDTKDECEGLKKAFDKVCSDDGEDEERMRRHRRRRQRRLWETTKPRFPWQAWVYDTYRTAQRLATYLFTKEAPFFFAEDSVADAWDDACYLVEHDLDVTVHQELLDRWQLERAYKARQHRLLVEQGLSSSNKTKPTNLALPTSKQHLSESSLSAGTLLMQQSGEVVEKAANQSKAAEEAKASSKAIKETNKAVSAVLNDPDSIAARTCCTSILNVYHENCSVDEDEDISDTRLLFVIFVMAICGIVKSLIRHFKILWLPEAAGCIIVGVLSGYALMFFPHHDFSFDGNWFLRILVPPIVFEAALGIDKRSFNRHVVPIIMYAFVGTLVATVVTAIIVHKGSLMLQGFCTPIPYVEALTFGALISSIDPIAVLSVLSNMGMTDTDTIYVVIFGESLLNDGVAIVLFNTLVEFLDENIVIDRQAVMAASIHFFVVAFGSLLIGVGSGMLCTVYYWLFHGCQTPLVEVLMFLCWALLPYYVCDGIGWSGIVSAVAAGFVMDLYVVGQKHDEVLNDASEQSPSKNGGDRRTDTSTQSLIFSGEGHLSDESRRHIGFVTEMISTMMETAIFAYLGLFLFSHRYHWNFWHTILAIAACCISRAFMIPTLSLLANSITRFNQTRTICRTAQNKQRSAPSAPGVIIDRKMQIVLWFAGLRGAMSFALVEHIPLYDSVSGEGTRLKPELKAMTSASIMFSVFILGGYTFYVMDALGIAPSHEAARKEPPSYEMTSLLAKSSRHSSGDDVSKEANGVDGAAHSSGAKITLRRPARHAD